MLTAMGYREIVLKEGKRYSLPPGAASQCIVVADDTLGAMIETLFGVRAAHHDDDSPASSAPAAGRSGKIGRAHV